MPDPDPKLDPKPIDGFAELKSKLDAIEGVLKGLLPKQDSKPPVDPLLESTLAVLRDGLEANFPKEDVAKMSQAELVLAHKLKKNFKAPKQDNLPMPPSAGTPAPIDPHAQILGYYAKQELK